jgi:hypothetical protein
LFALYRESLAVIVLVERIYVVWVVVEQRGRGGVRGDRVYLAPGVGGMAIVGNVISRWGGLNVPDVERQGLE